MRNKFLYNRLQSSSVSKIKSEFMETTIKILSICKIKLVQYIKMSICKEN